MYEDQPIIGIGLPKTGTNSMAAAVARLIGVGGVAHRPEQPVLQHYRNTGEWSMHGFRAIFDINPWPIEAMLRACPDALFVWTTRPLNEWLVSCADHFGRDGPPHANREGRLEIFGITTYHRRTFADIWRRHRTHVTWCLARYPQMRCVEHRLGVDGWDTICEHIGATPPPAGTPWPHYNRKGTWKTWH